ncbi:SBBP repeat-containing protein [Runella sp. MFBS21]|uniref:SBBP repeat-containing protein n=1 Tax=Runella sp. MFBS21 TaxID=3034018 RepID=UPI0023F874D2|nr:SBBP repeat-containing protein [Runella sp. MFBS21]MDF7821808.1 SBBP repeat-containing protein [Runella sp. MFBS21]
MAISNKKFILIGSILSFIIVLNGCEWADPLQKSLKTCVAPTAIMGTLVNGTTYSYTLTVSTPSDIKSVVWKIASGSATIMQTQKNDVSAFSYTYVSAGTYTISAEIETVCGTKSIQSTTIVINIKTCNLPTAINTLSISNNTYSYGLVTTSPGDVKSVLWKVISGTAMIAQESRTDANIFNYTFSTSGNYTISADIETTCGEKVTRTLASTITIRGISSNANFKTWKVGGAGNDIGQKVVLDASGNVYISGTYSSSIVFGISSIGVAGGKDVFISKFNSNGDLAWVQRITGDGDEESGDMVIDVNGDIYITGQVSTNAGFFNTPADVSSGNVARKTINGITDAFVAKYNRDGVLQWSKTYGANSPEGGTALALHNSGIYLTGVFGATSTKIGDITLQALGTLGKSDIFIAKLNYNGDATWAVSAGGFENDFPSNLAVDSEGNAYITGNFSSPATFRSYSGASTTYTSNTTPDIFVVKYNANGNLMAFHSANSGTPVYGSDIKISGGGLYITGNIGGTQYGNNAIDYRGGGGDIFLAKYNINTLNLEWIKTAGGSGFDGANEMIIDNIGNIYVSGLFSDNCLFETSTARTLGDTDAFIAQYDANGNFKFVRSLGSSGSDGVRSITINTAGTQLFLTGFYSATLFSNGTTLLPHSGGYDIFIAKYPD